MFCACTFTGTCPTACTASVWNVTFFSLQIFAISSIGCNVPISLFAYIIVTNAVSSRIAFSTSAGSTIPSAPTSSNVTSKPSRSNFLRVWRTAWCSIFVEIRCFFPFFAPKRAAERIAWLSASLPPEVK